jgi:hypothetical protein
MRSIKKIHKAIYAPMDDLVTWRALPTNEVDYIDPFLLLNHHGPQEYPPNNNGLPFGPHPHRGFETVTYILQGDIMHKDTTSDKSITKPGGIQWMTAGSGLIHSEQSSDEFKMNGGTEEVIQVWLNLPSRLKMTKPKYTGLQKEQIPTLTLDNGKVNINVISGRWGEVKGPVESLSGIQMFNIEFKMDGLLDVKIDENHNILFYVVNGKVKVNNEIAERYSLVEFANEGEDIKIEALENSYLVFGHGKPFREPVVSYGPFIMNTQGEIKQAMVDYQSGKMGVWKE